jgi:hypothetical protein
MMEEFMGDFNQIRKKALKGEFSNFQVRRDPKKKLTNAKIKSQKIFKAV